MEKELTHLILFKILLMTRSLKIKYLEKQGATN